MEEIERKIRAVKELGRGITNKLTYPCIPEQITMHMINFLTMWLNSLMAGNGISLKYQPRKTVMVHNMDSKKHCKVVFRSYVEAHENTNITIPTGVLLLDQQEISKGLIFFF